METDVLEWELHRTGTSEKIILNFSFFNRSRAVAQRGGPKVRFLIDLHHIWIRSTIFNRKNMATSTTAAINMAPTTASPTDADDGYLMFAATLVMLQTPGIGLFQAGLIRRKNALSILMQVFLGYSMGSMLWFLCGFSFSFGDPWISSDL